MKYVVLFILVGALLASCDWFGKDLVIKPSEDLPIGKANLHEQGEVAFNVYCGSCHGIDGSGEGPAAPALAVKPRDFRDANWQRSVSDERIMQVIEGGGRAANLSYLMPGWRGVFKKSEIKGLVLKVRSFAPGVDLTKPQAPEMRTAHEIYNSLCIKCHGGDGKGNGPLVSRISTRPPDFTDPNWQRSRTDKRIKNVIRLGGGPEGLCLCMPGLADLTPHQLESFVGLVRRFGETRASH